MPFSGIDSETLQQHGLANIPAAYHESNLGAELSLDEVQALHAAELLVNERLEKEANGLGAWRIDVNALLQSVTDAAKAKNRHDFELSGQLDYWRNTYQGLVRDAGESEDVFQRAQSALKEILAGVDKGMQMTKPKSTKTSPFAIIKTFVPYLLVNDVKCKTAMKYWSNYLDAGIKPLDCAKWYTDRLKIEFDKYYLGVSEESRLPRWRDAERALRVLALLLHRHTPKLVRGTRLGLYEPTDIVQRLNLLKVQSETPNTQHALGRSNRMGIRARSIYRLD